MDDDDDKSNNNNNNNDVCNNVTEVTNAENFRPLIREGDEQACRREKKRKRLLTAERSFTVCFQIEVPKTFSFISTVPHSGTFAITLPALSFLELLVILAWKGFPLRSNGLVLMRCSMQVPANGHRSYLKNVKCRAA